MTAPQSPGGSLQVHELLCWLASNSYTKGPLSVVLAFSLKRAVSFLQFVLIPMTDTLFCLYNYLAWWFQMEVWVICLSGLLVPFQKELR
jgi:hypothetical protein